MSEHTNIENALELLKRCMATVETITAQTQRTLDALISPQIELTLDDLELDGDGYDPLVEFEGVLPEFKAPMHRYAIAMADGNVAYVDQRVGSILSLDDYYVNGQAPTVEDLGIV